MRAGQVTDKIFFAAIYTMVAVLVVHTGRGIVHYALDAAFYRDYLQPWERSLVALRNQTAQWPAYDRQDPVGYMQALTAMMKARGIAPPSSNTAQAFIYRFARFGRKPHKVLLVGTPGRMILYNVPARTFERLDRFIDGRFDPEAGAFTGQGSADGATWIAYRHI